MKKQLKLTSQPITFGEVKSDVQEKKKTLQSSFFEELKDELKKYEYVTSNEYFKKNFDIEKMKTFSRVWDMYRKLKAKAHEVVQTGFEMYKNCEKKLKDATLEAVIDTYNTIKAKEDKHDNENVLKQDKEKEENLTIETIATQPSLVVWRTDKKDNEKAEDKQMNEIYLILFFGLQLRSLCDWLFTNVSSQKTDVSNEEEILCRQRHHYFNETIPTFIQKTKQKIYYQDLSNKDKKLVDKISLGYDSKTK